MAKRREPTQQPVQEPTEFLNPWNHRGWIAYLTNLLPRFQHVRFVGYPSLKDVKNTRIERLYVPVQLSSRYVPPEQVEQAERQNVHELLAEHGRLVVLGDPGSGKSTLISYLTTMLASRRPNVITEALGNLIPLPFILRDLVIDRHITVDGLLDQFCHQHFWPEELSRQDLDDVLRRQQALIFWDGLDEIGDQQNRRALRDVFVGLATQFPRCKWILTSRLVGYDDVRFHYPGDPESIVANAARSDLDPSLAEPDEETDAGEQWTRVAVKLGILDLSEPRTLSLKRIADVTYLVPFDDEQISLFAHNWYAARDEYAIQQSAEDFLKAIHGNSATERLARRPNLLTMMALIYRVRARLPNGRALLYDEITDAYLHTIDEEKKLNLVPYPLAEKKRWLARVAYEMQLRRAEEAEKSTQEEEHASQEILIDQEQIAEWIADSMRQSGYGGTRDEASAFVDYIARRSGLLLPRGLDAAGKGQFAFVHLSFQEYFAAVRLAEQILRPRFLDRGDQMPPPRPRDFPEFAQRDVWRETLYFLVEMFGSREGWPRELLDLLFGQDFRIVQVEKRDEKSRAAAMLLALLVIDPHSGLKSDDRQRVIRVCCEWQARWNKGREDSFEKLFGNQWNRVLDVLLGAESPEQLRITVDAWIDATREVGLLNLDFRQTRLSDLSLLAGLSGLTSLDLGGTKVSDLSPLAGLSGLTTLGLTRTPVSDLSPLVGLSGLTTLDFSNTKVSDLSPLAGLSGLTTLYFMQTPVSDLSPLAGLGGLTTLYLNITPVSDLSPLVGLSRLTTLNFGRAKVSDLSPLAGLSGLKTLHLNSTPVSDLSPLAGLSGLTALYLNSTPVSDLSPLAGLSGLTALYLNSTPMNDLSPLAGLSGLTTLHLNNTPVSDLSPLAGLKKLEHIWLSQGQDVRVPKSLEKVVHRV